MMNNSRIETIRVFREVIRQAEADPTFPRSTLRKLREAQRQRINVYFRLGGRAEDISNLGP